MAVKIVGTTSGVEMDVEALPKAAKVTLYDASGNSLLPNLTFAGVALINVRQSAATGATAVVWGIHNPSSTKTVLVRKLWLNCFFDGTAAATLMKYEVLKATGVTAFSGGTVVTPLSKITSQSQASSVRLLDTGLTTTGATFGGAATNIAMGRVTQTTTNFQANQQLMDWTSLQAVDVKLVQNELLCIRQTVTSVIGDNIVGYCEFSEF